MQTLREKCKLFITLCRGVSHPIKTRGHCHARIFDRADSFLFSGSLDAVCSALLASPQKAVELAVATGCGICLWSGVMEVARQAGLLKALSNLFSPIVSRLFPRIKKDSAAAQAVCVNLAANLLGLGAAAAPAGIRAQAGSAEPMAILPAVWVSTALSLTAGIIAAKAMACLSPLSARPHPGTCTRKRCRR